MDKARIQRLQARLGDHMERVDELALVALKGHLLLEESLYRIISGFVFHPEHLNSARLSFARRVCIARSLSLDEHNNAMWELVLAINSLRNDLAHELRSRKRAEKVRRVKELVVLQTRGTDDNSPVEEFPEDHHVVYLGVALCLGFLDGFEAEVERFRHWVDSLDRAVNPHRHASKSSD